MLARGSLPHHGSASLALGARPTTNSHCTEKSLLQLHIQVIACCQVPGPGNAAEVANTSTGKETTEQMLSAPEQLDTLLRWTGQEEARGLREHLLFLGKECSAETFASCQEGNTQL